MRAFYVTIVRGKRVGWLAGPYDTKQGAESRVALCRRISGDIDPWTDFDGFGVSALNVAEVSALEDFPMGRLQSHIDHYETYGVVNW